MALPLDTKTRSIIAESLTNTFNNSSGETTIIPVGAFTCVISFPSLRSFYQLTLLDSQNRN